MKLKIKSLAVYFLLSAALLLLCCLIKVGADFTNSGIISFYPIELAGLGLGAYILFYIIKKWKDISKENRIFLLLTLIFTAYCITDYTMRIITRGLELKSILVLESNLFVVGFMFIILLKIVPVKRALSFICCFACVLGILSVVLYFFIVYDISNIILLNHATRTFLLGVFLPLTAYQYLTRKDRLSSACFYIHVSTLVFCGLVSGARVNYVMIPLIIIFSIILLARNKIFSWIKTVLSIIIPLIVVFVSANYYVFTYAELTRLPVTNAIVRALNITYKGRTSGDIHDSLSYLIKKFNSVNMTEPEREILLEEIAMKAAQLSADESTSIRFYAWQQSVKDIEKDPLFGIGLQQYSSTSSDGQLTVPIQSHNFILEYTLSFGIIGFLIWAVMFFAPVFYAYKSIRFKIWRNNAALCYASSIIFTLAGAFFQPYFLFPCVMAFVYAIIGCFYLFIRQEGNIQLAEKL